MTAALRMTPSATRTDEYRLADQLARSAAWGALVLDSREAARGAWGNKAHFATCSGCGREFTTRDERQVFHNLKCARQHQGLVRAG